MRARVCQGVVVNTNQCADKSRTPFEIESVTPVVSAAIELVPKEQPVMWIADRVKSMCPTGVSAEPEMSGITKVDAIF